MTVTRSAAVLASLPLFAAALYAPALHAQSPSVHCSASTLAVEGVHDHGTDYARLIELAGGAPLRSWLWVEPRHQRRVPYCAPTARTPWDASLRLGQIASPRLLELLPVSGVLHYNSEYPRPGNDGALRAGRGAALGVTGGVHGGWGPISFAFAPAAAFQDNLDFTFHPEPVPGHSEWVYSSIIDWPYRHGEESYWTLDPGQSHLALRGFGFEAGFTTENLWLGPGRRNSLLMTTAGPGVPRGFVGTAAPLDIRIGTVEANVFWGQTRESAYFDDDPDNDRNLLAGVAVVFQPAPLPGLFLGAARTYMNPWPADGLSLDLLLRPYRGVRDNPGAGELIDNNLLALYLRWALPASGFEVYAEWGREDGWADWTDVLTEPDHSQGYVLGLQKVTPFGSRWLRVAGELAHLHSSAPIRGGRGAGSWYRHTGVRQGYTHRGQLIGAAIGPGSDAQFIGVDVFDAHGRTGLSIERVRHDEERYYERWARLYGMHGHDVELTGALSRDYNWDDLDFGASIGYSSRRNRHFLGHETGQWNLRTERNVGVTFRVTWRP